MVPMMSVTPAAVRQKPERVKEERTSLHARKEVIILISRCLSLREA